MLRFASLTHLPRRDLLKWMGAATAAAALPGCERKSPAVALTPAFFTPAERTALAALADAVLPPDDKPGGAALGAVDFIERLMTVFESADALLFAGGPYSGRTPFPNPDGTPSTRYPDNDFLRPLPLDRVSERAWRLTLYGSDGVPGGGPNDAVLGKVIGLRDQMKQGLAAAIAGTPFQKLDPGFQGLVISLVCQAAFGAPEYGGNPGGLGWKMVHYEGDSQPLGYSQWVEATQSYAERPEAPLSTPNPGADPEPMDQSTRDFVATIVSLAGGKAF